MPNLTSELTVDQFDMINFIMTNPEFQNYERWLELFIYMGVPEEVFDDMPLSELNEHINAFNDQGDPVTEKVHSVNIEGFEYVAPEVVGAKDISLIEKEWKRSRDHFSSYCLAVLFKRADLSRNEHYSTAHIKHKQTLFGNQKIDIGVAHIGEVLKSLVKTTENANTNELEPDHSGAVPATEGATTE